MKGGFIMSEKGFADSYIALVISVTAIMLILVFSVELLILPKSQNALQTAVEMLARSDSINGCVTNNTQSAVSNYLTKNQLDITKVYFNNPPNSVNQYGASTNLVLGYDLNVFQLGPTDIWSQYIQAQSPVNMSSYVSNASSDTSGCASINVFTGTVVTPKVIGR